MNIAVEHLSFISSFDTTVVDQLDTLSGCYCLSIELIVLERLLLILFTIVFFVFFICKYLLLTYNITITTKYKSLNITQGATLQYSYLTKLILLT